MKAIFKIDHLKFPALVFFFLMSINMDGQVSHDTVLTGNIEPKYVVVTGTLIKVCANSSGETIVFEKSPAIDGFPQYVNTGHLESDVKTYMDNKSKWIKTNTAEIEEVIKNEIKVPMSVKKTVYPTK